MSPHGKQRGRRRGGRRRAGASPTQADAPPTAPPPGYQQAPPYQQGPPQQQGPPARGARTAAAQGRRPRRRRRSLVDLIPLPLVAVLVLLAALVGVGELTLPERRTQIAGLEAAKAAVTSARVVCPFAPAQQIAVAAPGKGKGEVTVQPLGSSTGSPLGALRTAPGRAVADTVDENEAVVASAEGATAPGFEVEQYSRSDSGVNRGIRDVRCTTPSTDWWFAGAATTAGNTTDLYLSNLDRSASTVDIVAYGEDGVIDPEAGRGITIDPGKRRVVKLSEIAPELATSAVRVFARSGRVAAAMHTGVRDGDTSYGGAWVPPSTPKAGNIVVPAVPSGSGDRKLVLFAPGEQDTTVGVRLSTPTGSFAPEGKDKVNIPAQQAIEVDLGDVMTKSATALQVSSDVPLVASVVAVEGGSGEDGGVAFSAGTPALSSPATVPLVPTGKIEATLHLTAAVEDAQVDVRTMSPRPSAPRTVRIPAGRTVQVKLTPPRGDSAYGIIVTPRDGSGPVYGSRVLTASPKDGPLIASLGLVPGVHQVSLPPVVPEIGAGVPR
ncbi:MAG: hypothetical protein GEV10_00975 [Streptosporangiales bacterium]|nr:hypothetical protein [Streptosporangiales bacterium]